MFVEARTSSHLWSSRADPLFHQAPLLFLLYLTLTQAPLRDLKSDVNLTLLLICLVIGERPPTKYSSMTRFASLAVQPIPDSLHLPLASLSQVQPSDSSGTCQRAGLWFATVLTMVSSSTYHPTTKCSGTRSQAFSSSPTSLRYGLRRARAP